MPVVAAVAGFNYAVAGEHADWLRGVAESIRDFARRSALSLLRIGLKLTEAKARIKPYTFRNWVAAETPFTARHCYRLMAAAKAFAPLIAENASEVMIDPTAFYLLADVKVPEGARVLAVDLSRRRRVTVADAKQIIREVCGSGDELKPIAIDRYHRQVAKLGVGVGDAPAPDVLTPWQALVRLYHTCRIVHVSRITQDGEQLASVTLYLDDDGAPVRNVARASLADAVMAAAELEEVRAAWKARNEQVVNVVL